MNKQIWKFDITHRAMVGIDMPKGAEILSLQYQGRNLCFWALVDPNAEKENRTFTVHGTGHDIIGSDKKFHIGTVQTGNGCLVWHVFEILE